MGGPKRPSHRGTAQFQQKSAEAKQLDPVRHVTLPPVPYTGCINFHFFRLTFCLVAMLLQYLNLYRTVWWLPKLKARFILVGHPFCSLLPHMFARIWRPLIKTLSRMSFYFS
uniref:Transmembrane protein 39A n=1 Tax=Schistocephalus solidus TaxID=70667 RepID=A0A0X3Q0E4_SCHSO